MPEKKKYLPNIRIELCCSCAVCVDSCPVDCLFLTVLPESKSNHRYPYMPERSICIGCARCATDCPVDAID